MDEETKRVCLIGLLWLNILKEKKKNDAQVQRRRHAMWFREFYRPENRATYSIWTAIGRIGHVRWQENMSEHNSYGAIHTKINAWIKILLT